MLIVLSANNILKHILTYFGHVNSLINSGGTSTSLSLTLSILIFTFYYKNVIFGFHNFNHKDSDAFFFIDMFLFLAKFHITENLNSFYLKKELEQYMRTISSSKNTKALKTINICKTLNLFTCNMLSYT